LEQAVAQIMMLRTKQGWSSLNKIGTSYDSASGIRPKTTPAQALLFLPGGSRVTDFLSRSVAQIFLLCEAGLYASPAKTSGGSCREADEPLLKKTHRFPFSSYPDFSPNLGGIRPSSWNFLRAEETEAP
jgi:hypothetical protein